MKCCHNGRAVADYYIRVKLDYFFRQTKHALKIACGVSVLHVEVLTDNPPLFCKALFDSFGASLSLLIIRYSHQHPNNALAGRLLRICREGAHCQRGTEKSYECAPLRIHPRHPCIKVSKLEAV